MCGIFGAIGKPNENIIRALALANRERGTDSLGFFASSGKIAKHAGDPLHVLSDPKISDFIAQSHKYWFLAGHTRAATRGAITSKNAHPFRYGRIIGAHNGIVSAPKRYAVDSEYLFDKLNENNGDYQTALEEVSGWWGLSWFDGEHFYLQAYGNGIGLAKDKRGTWYYSSDWAHLTACVRLSGDYLDLRGGDTVRFNLTGSVEVMPTFVPRVAIKRASKITYAKPGKAPSTASAPSTDPFYYDDSAEDWAGVERWEQYTRDYT